MSKQRPTVSAKSRSASKTSTTEKAADAIEKAVNATEQEMSHSESESAVAVGDQVSAPTITIDGQVYTLESLGQQGREQLQNLRVTDQELQRLQDQLAITQTARNTYARILAEVTKTVTPVK
ncbi:MULTISPECIES: DUF6447 family protein [Halomonas]|uniref:DUF6447 family protein n=1 Tax=Halomonas TaxID=2745 RepID=UPI000A65815B|nr:MULTISPECIES: DUF6447 family protein [Halomonas]